MRVGFDRSEERRTASGLPVEGDGVVEDVGFGAAPGAAGEGAGGEVAGGGEEEEGLRTKWKMASQVSGGTVMGGMESVWEGRCQRRI